MLKAEQIKELAKRAGCNSEILAKALSSTTEDALSFEAEGEFITHAELEEIKIKAGKDSYEEGKKIGDEKFIRELRRLTGLEGIGRDAEKLISAMKEKMLEEAKIEPTKRITELEADNKKLKDLVTEKETELTAATEKYNSQLDGLTIEQTIKSKLPEKLANGLSREDAYTLFMAKNKVQKAESGLVLIDPETKQVIKDKKLNPIAIDDHIKAFAESFGKVNDDGRGDGDKRNKIKTNIEGMTKRSEVEEHFEKNNTPLSERAGILAKAMKNEGFKINE